MSRQSCTCQQSSTSQVNGENNVYVDSNIHNSKYTVMAIATLPT